ncbi:TPA: ABC transporter ATP-binding protein [Citrobacter farmeri]|jgi:lipopolysaccharide transport system ATP-binding protein|uniref:ABC transporter ATP-binding protein n=1 Tax=Enterobacteriaceae TaxID=543 RepID=UPI001A1D9FAE|nr:ABC transporter ATP-binding protein [Citrobacter freundii]EKN4845530.1 ABC transporter ATP-binding protein [Yersinia enterocolitica]HAT3946076.1 ABC transporter ATP-binding protein [Kluyvera ascorbata]HAY5199092.1 ABC transporter ATP-binding protein [Escherichia coli]HBC0359436.1 ABC transporter ATP-binding protein [Citrobacter farmeri]HBZ8836849.1 ABC transporter ATP-binding protein [Citrobacter farmeri]
MHISSHNIGVRFPIFDSNNRSFKKTLMSAASGGKIGSSKKGVTEIESLKNITFNIEEGDRLGLIGHNGSGKTTLLRVLSGAYKPTSGNLKTSGKITSLIDPMMGMDHELTGIENIKLRGLFLGMKKKEINNIIDDVIDFSELGDFINIPVRTYSSGMILRLGFAISTSIQPEILLMDEWMSVGDDSFRKKAEERLQNIISKAGILVLATHDKELAKNLCNKNILLEHGEAKEMKGF